MRYGHAFTTYMPSSYTHVLPLQATPGRPTGHLSTPQLATPSQRIAPSRQVPQASGSQHASHYHPPSPDVKIEQDAEYYLLGDINDPRRLVSPNKIGPRTSSTMKKVAVQQPEDLSDEPADNNEDDESDTDVLALVAGSGVCGSCYRHQPVSHFCIYRTNPINNHR